MNIHLTIETPSRYCCVCGMVLGISAGRDSRCASCRSRSVGAADGSDVRRLERALWRCLQALDMEALAADEWKKPLVKCGAWYQVRREGRRALAECPACRTV